MTKKVCMIGLGYIGLPTAIIAAKHGGMDVIGVDINESVVSDVNTGKLHFIEPGLPELLKEVEMISSYQQKHRLLSTETAHG